ncbi:MAG TPA: FAD-dependent oxidoreductase [Humibacter sp.]|nr:FAD-dependent oxidoreductase [Humibacter sp.]
MTAATALRVVVIGYGPVGARFADALLPSVRTGHVELTVVGAETADAYNRVLVAEYAVGNTEWDDMVLHSADDVRSAGARVELGMRVVRIDRAASAVELADGEFVEYDRLVIATGARANVPTLEGVERTSRDALAIERSDSRLVGTDDDLPRGITVLRDLDDARRVGDATRNGQKIVVLGAGVLGLELALLAARAGAETCVVHHGPIPMPRNLDIGGGTVLAASLRRAGVAVVGQSRAEAVVFRTDDDGERRFDALGTADGKHIHGDLLVLSCGVGARSELATASGLKTAAGIVVTPDLRSWTDPKIYAIGDCAHVAVNYAADADTRIPGGPSGLIGPGWRQAEWLAARFASIGAGGEHDTDPLVERPAVVMLKGEDVDIVAVGDVCVEPWDVEHEDDRSARAVSQWADPEHGRYVKMITRDGVLEGFVSVGMPRTSAELTLLFERGGELPADRSLLLRFDGPDYSPEANADAFAPDATVCWCNGVSVAQIQSAAAEGNDTVACIGKATRAGTGCGGCKGRIAELLERFTDADGVAV